MADFDTQQAIWVHLGNGGQVIDGFGHIYSFVNGKLISYTRTNLELKTPANDFNIIYNYKIYVAWYDNLENKPALCWVWDDPIIRQPAVVIRYLPHEEYPFTTTDTYAWKYAKPIQSTDEFIVTE